MARPAHPRLALGLLVAGMAAHYLWRAAPVEAQADLWNAGQALLQVALLGLIAAAWPSVEVRAACVLIGIYALLAAGCSLAWLLAPWPIEPGAEQCSAALNLPVGLIGSAFGAILAGYLYRKSGDPHG